MGVTSKLVFDPTDADSRAAGATIGAHVLSGLDGSQIGHETLNSVDWLRTAGPITDSAGNEVGVTAGALDVNIASAISVDVDDSLADTDIANASTPVGVTAVDILTSALAGRKWLYLANNDNKTLYFGKTGVTTANGFPMGQGQQIELRIGPSVMPQIIGGPGSSAQDLRVMELS